jgi:hypothetical protein
MSETQCPWCELPLELAVDQSSEQQCPECLTTWRYEDEYEAELALAA